MFKVARLYERMQTPPAMPIHDRHRATVHEWKRIMRYWDKAGTAGGGAWTVGTLMGLDTRDRFWILDVRRGQWATDEREAIIKATAQQDGRGITVGIEQEPGSGGKESAEATVKNLAGWRVHVDRPTGDKVMRADPFSVQVNIGNVYMAPGEWNADYISELQYFPYSTYKDQVDSSSGNFAWLTGGHKKRAGGLVPAVNDWR